VIEQVEQEGGLVGLSNLLRGTYGVPGVGYGGAGTGLSADGRTLVLENFASAPQARRTRLAVLNGHTLLVRAHISLPGFFTVDAISPTGRWLYLTHYRSFSNISHYEVRAYDLAAGKLLAKPVVDPREPDEKMQGTPMTRAVSAGGRWDYTLYDRGNEAPFIHALDTTGRRAFCVDLPRSLNKQIGSLQLSLGPGALRIMNDATTLAVVDTRTFAVRRGSSGSDSARTPVAHRPAATHPATSHRNGGAFPWLPTLLGFVAFAAAGLLARRRRQTGSSATSRWTRAA
jgi:hypothetical protein